MEELVRRLLRYKKSTVSPKTGKEITFKQLSEESDISEQNFYRWMKGGKMSRSNKKNLKDYLDKKD